MAGEQIDQLEPGRKHIIERPRLTRILDESTARVLMLVAPAGYGKTTLARQWLEDKRHVWYQGGPASADVAALAAGLADACATVIPNAGDRMRARLRVTNSPEEDVEPLAELLAEDLVAWPKDAWLAIDDYHYAMASPAAEKFFDVVMGNGGPMFVIARERPTWVTARRLLYGEVHEIGRAALAMDQDEVAKLFSTEKPRQATGLLALADGWPAVIGLAASSPGTSLPEEVPDPLYDFFAQELLNALPEHLEKALELLALAPWINAELAGLLVGDSSSEALKRGEQIGVLNRDAKGRFVMHPLLRTFLVDRLVLQGESDNPKTHDASIKKLITFYSRLGDWDAAFAVVDISAHDELLSRVLDESLPVLLSTGRIPTLAHWLARAERKRLRAPVLDLAAAEVAYRHGDGIRARSLADHALGLVPQEDPIRGALLLVAGKAALLLHETEAAVAYMKDASEEKLTADQSYDAAWGRFLAAARLEAPDASDRLAELETMSSGIADRELRTMNGRWVLAVRTGIIHGLVDQFEAASHVVPKATDPLIRSAFLISRVHLLALLARYREALATVEILEGEAREFRLEFAVPHISMAKALVYLGLREFTQATRLLTYCEKAGIQRSDVFVQMNSAALRGRLLLYQGSAAEAATHLSERWSVLPERSLHAEYLSLRGLALATQGRLEDALTQCEEVSGMSHGIEARVLQLAARAVVDLRRGGRQAADLVQRLVDTSIQTGNHDGLLFACRISSELADAVATPGHYGPRLADVIRRAEDHAMARRLGLPLPPRTSTDCLTPREHDVYELIALGRTNREIAAALFISEPTAKVHTLHILEKLGLRSRTEVALHATDGTDA